MAYLCPTPYTDTIIAINNKSVKTSAISVNVNLAGFIKNIKSTVPSVNSIDAILTKTITEPSMAYNNIFTPAMSKAAFMPIMSVTTSSETRPASGQMWPRNITARNVTVAQPSSTNLINTYTTYGGF